MIICAKSCASFANSLGLRCKGRGGTAQIHNLSRFQGIDFAHLRESPAKYIPEILHETDTSNFDPVEPRQESPSSTLTHRDQKGGRRRGMDPRGGKNEPDDHAFYE